MDYDTRGQSGRDFSAMNYMTCMRIDDPGELRAVSQDDASVVPNFSSGSGWHLADPSGTTPEAISVFGPPGSMSCVVILHRSLLPTSMTSETGEWMLCRDSAGTGRSALFSLQWALDAPGSGCVALCGREIPRFHLYPA